MCDHRDDDDKDKNEHLDKNVKDNLEDAEGGFNLPSTSKLTRANRFRCFKNFGN